jgi:alpha-L-rhamnosidase
MFVENLVNPIGLDNDKPRFTWIMSSDEKNKFQSAYQLRVAMEEEDLVSGSNLLWDSEKVTSDQSVFLEYAGPDLESGKRYYWQIKAWDEDDKASEWSETGYWQMGFLNPLSDFKADWISPSYEEQESRPSPVFRKEFEVGSIPIKKATAYITAHGMYEAFLNEKRVGDAYFTPGWTSYNNRLQYQVYDISDDLVAGSNEIHVSLGNGWYRGYLAWADARDHYGSDIALLMQIEIEFNDGSKQIILTDESWESSTGPIIFSELYDGEIFDSRLKPSTWSAVKIQDFTKDNLIATYNEPIRKKETFKPIDFITTPNGEKVLDFGQNLVGWVQVRTSGNSGDSIVIYHAEVLDKEGNFYTENLRAAKQKAIYVLNGESEQLLEPHFTFMGFRYINVTKYPGDLDPNDFTAIALYSDMEPTGTFECSNPLLNQLQHNIQWGQKGNFLDVPTDCPQRDERLGWTGDAQAFFRTAAYNMNVNNFFAKWLKDLAADQRDDGGVPFVIPNVLGQNSAGSAGWADAATIIPWETYLLYGDKQVLEDQYTSMKAWVEYMRAKSKDNLWNTGFHFGDWLFFRPGDDNDGRAAVTDKYFITQCFFAYSTQLLVNTAKVLGKAEDIREYSQLLTKIKDAFMHEYVSPSGRLGPNTQTSYVLVLHFDMLPEEMRAQAAKRLVNNIKSYGNHLTTGFLGTPYLCHVLSRFGYEDMAYTLLLQETYPSWLYPVKMGATTIWERWDGIKPDSTFQNPGMNSYNHYAYGAIGDWMYRNVVGINTNQDGPGYKSIKIKPIIGGDLSYARGTLITYYGLIESGWELDESSLRINVSVPVNTNASIFIPAPSIEKITVDGKRLKSSKEIEILEFTDGHIGLKVGSGQYKIEVDLTN